MGCCAIGNFAEKLGLLSKITMHVAIFQNRTLVVLGMESNVTLRKWLVLSGDRGSSNLPLAEIDNRA